MEGFIESCECIEYNDCYDCMCCNKEHILRKRRKFVNCENEVNVRLLRMYELTNICKDHLTKKYFLPLNVVNLVNLKNIDYFEGREKLLTVRM